METPRNRARDQSRQQVALVADGARDLHRRVHGHRDDRPHRLRPDLHLQAPGFPFGAGMDGHP